MKTAHLTFRERLLLLAETLHHRTLTADCAFPFNAMSPTASAMTQWLVQGTLQPAPLQHKLPSKNQPKP